MPINTDEMTVLMENDYQDGIVQNASVDGITHDKLINGSDTDLFYRMVASRDPSIARPGGYDGNGYTLNKPLLFSKGYKNPFISHLAQGRANPYWGWEINYYKAGMWTRISQRSPSLFWGYTLPRPSKWGSDRGKWFDAGYNYAGARMNGWNPFHWSGNDA